MINQKRLDVLTEICTVGFVEHGTPAPPAGLAGMTELLGGLLEIFPDMLFEVEDWVISGDRVVARGRVEATHRGEFLGMPATGKVVSWTALHLWRLEEGRLAERWSEANLLGILNQLTAD